MSYQTMHEYLTLCGDNSQYGECIDCNKRTPHICLKCNYCYSCHFKVERMEKEYPLKQIIIPANERRRLGNRLPTIFTTYTIPGKRKWLLPPMGRTIPSFRIASVMEEMEWRVFRNSLDKSDRKKFDEMFSIAHLYNSASSYAARPIRINPIIMSIIFHHYKRLVKLSKEINEL